jgi:Na+-transporting NADH:ubiquinone oxidoreductase subunit NqrD
VGEIIWYSLIRLFISIIFLWLTKSYWGEKYFFLIVLISLVVIVIYPAVKSYKTFIEKNKSIIEGSICSTCKHFNFSAVICMKYDKHPTSDNIPCNGTDWEP